MKEFVYWYARENWNYKNNSSYSEMWNLLNPNEIRNYITYKESGDKVDSETLKTLKQWEELNKTPKDGYLGMHLYTSGFRSYTADYYFEDEVRDMTEDEILAKKEEERAWARKKYRLAHPLEEVEFRRNRRAMLSKIKKINSKLGTKKLPDIKTSKTIILDVETTGLDSKQDEILQLSIINDNNEILWNKYYKPEVVKCWWKAEEIHGITREKVENCGSILDDLEEIYTIMKEADRVIGYNVWFDLNFLGELILEINDKDKVEIYDVMEEFAPIYGEQPEWLYGEYKWQTLETCADYYGYEFKAHDSLEDCKATLYCYKKMHEKNSSKDYTGR